MTRRGIAALLLFDLAALLVVAGLVSLAVWQTHRRAWKHDLVARIETRVHAPAVEAPSPERWAEVSAASDEYRHVTATGEWVPATPALVQAVTELGGGFWVMAPLARADGSTVLVNRGFVPSDKRDPSTWTVPAGNGGTVTGLLRIPEPGGAFLRSNDPAADRWFSRDVAAIAASRGLTTVAPYFIDAARPSGTGTDVLPVAGLTVLAFTDNHVVYAVTWGILAVMAAAGAVLVNVEALRRGRIEPTYPPCRVLES